ncbi:hypothetical protein A0H81_06714 [Grifola frondosa]|uniref:Fungal-type protein kinase domain-containing protein n=1 Tax=Grifola frondosa TaxID=5627 RepID=A0A1C7M7C5_GRIFR|nr:hypothetical protein A0H81_06714 [Grifola frondosa]
MVGDNPTMPSVPTFAIQLLQTESHCLSSDDTAKDPNSKRIRQKLHDGVQREFRHAVFDDPSFLDNLLPIPSNIDIHHIVSTLSEQRSRVPISYDKLQWLHTPERKPPKIVSWTPHSSQKSTCKALAWFFNSVLEVFGSTYGAAHLSGGDDSDAFLGGLLFQVWHTVDGQDNLDRHNTTRWMKPDLINRYGISGDQATWGILTLAVEVKSNWKEMVAQAATHARCLLAYHQSWSSTIVLVFDHKQQALAVCHFSRSGLVLSPKMFLSEKEGFEDAVRTIVGLKFLSRTKGGVDPSRSNNKYCLPMGVYTISTKIPTRTAIYGRAPRVSRVNKGTTCLNSAADENKTDAAHPRTPPRRINLIVDIGTRGTKRSRPESNDGSAPNESATNDKPVLARPVDRAFCEEIAKAYEDAKNVSSSTSDDDNAMTTDEQEWEWQWEWPGWSSDRDDDSSHLHCQQIEQPILSSPQSLIIKDSWPLTEKVALLNGRSMFKDAKGLFGIPEVLASYQVHDIHGQPITTKRFISSVAKPSSLFCASNEAKFQERVLFREIIKTEGRDLTDAETVQDLIRGILHAMLGLYNGFKKGWTHRDVSIGNVLLLVCPEDRPTDSLECLTPQRRQNLGRCTGMIVDEDQEIESKTLFDPARQRHISRSGTWPFISIRILYAIKEMPIPTAIDDLESFMWVLIWAVLEIRQKKTQLTSQERMLFADFNEPLQRMINFKLSCDRLLDTAHEMGELGPSLAAIFPLFQTWYDIALRYRHELEDILELRKPSASDLPVLHGDVEKLCSRAFSENPPDDDRRRNIDLDEFERPSQRGA